jgi:endonuclease YncB( thermonuclease family)
MGRLPSQMLPLIVFVLVLAVCSTTLGFAEPIKPSAIEVIDGDTIRANGRTVRLVGFDAPEAGYHARCESERALAAKATSRLRQLISRGGLDLQLVPCACRMGNSRNVRSRWKQT